MSKASRALRQGGEGPWTLTGADKDKRRQSGNEGAVLGFQRHLGPDPM